MRRKHLHSELSYKRIEKGVFRLAALERPNRIRTEIEAAELALILEGIDLSQAKRRKRFTPRKTA
jgi:hypothetical protein